MVMHVHGVLIQLRFLQMSHTEVFCAVIGKVIRGVDAKRALCGRVDGTTKRSQAAGAEQQHLPVDIAVDAGVPAASFVLRSRSSENGPDRLGDSASSPNRDPRWCWCEDRKLCRSTSWLGERAKTTRRS